MVSGGKWTKDSSEPCRLDVCGREEKTQSNWGGNLTQPFEKFVWKIARMWLGQVDQLLRPGRSVEHTSVAGSTPSQGTYANQPMNA